MIKVLSRGFYTTVQDLGRFGYRDKGVPVSGVMDTASAHLANMLLGNDKNDSLLEITMTGPRLQFNCNTCIVITGANLSPSVNSKSIKNNKVYDIHKGDILSFGNLLEGFRAYLAVKNGFKTTNVLGSRSQYLSITGQSTLKKNQVLDVEEFPYSKLSGSNASIHIKWIKEGVLNVFKGPEFELLTKNQKKKLEDSFFTIAKENSRMAYQLEETLDIHTHSILTSATLPGTVQLTPAGKLIILMKDAQTTGGYPRVLQLSEEALCVLSQKKTGDKIKFNLQEN